MVQESTQPEYVNDAIEGSSPPLLLHADIVGRVNFAATQNKFAVIRSLSLENKSNVPIENLTVTLTAHPPIISEKTWRIDRIDSESDHSLRDISTHLDAELLSGLNEAEHGNIRIVVNGPDGQNLAEEKYSVQLLARDEWGGTGDMAQLIAAFVSPNDPVVAAILKDASILLENAGHDGSIDGYQSKDPQRVWLLVGAIWSAATGLGLSYANPPTSFEKNGQKIRSPERIRSESLASCLDSTLLLSAAFEAAGLNPAVPVC